MVAANELEVAISSVPSTNLVADVSFSQVSKFGLGIST